MSEALTAMQRIVMKQRKIRADTEYNLHKLNTSKKQRIMKCPICGRYAKSSDPGEPFICKCGWRSDKANGETR